MSLEPEPRSQPGPRRLPPVFPADPRILDLDQRRRSLRDHAAEQQHWLERLRRLCDTAPPADDFPAFLLATPAFASLRQRLGHAADRRALPADVADELDHFALAFRDYLRTCAGEDAFASPSQRAG
jgi:hypothetical protein